MLRNLELHAGNDNDDELLISYSCTLQRRVGTPLVANKQKLHREGDNAEPYLSIAIVVWFGNIGPTPDELRACTDGPIFPWKRHRVRP